MSDEQAGLDPDEPHTPTWFTFLGLSLFLFAGIFFLATSSSEESEAGAPSDATAEAAAPATTGADEQAD